MYQGQIWCQQRCPSWPRDRSSFRCYPGVPAVPHIRGRLHPLAPQASPSAQRERQPEAEASNLRLLRFQLVERKTRPFISV